MSIKILNEYEEDGLIIKEYTKDGLNVSHSIKTPVQIESQEPEAIETTLEDKINFIYYKNMGVI